MSRANPSWYESRSVSTIENKHVNELYSKIVSETNVYAKLDTMTLLAWYVESCIASSSTTNLRDAMHKRISTLCANLGREMNEYEQLQKTKHSIEYINNVGVHQFYKDELDNITMYIRLTNELLVMNRKQSLRMLQKIYDRLTLDRMGICVGRFRYRVPTPVIMKDSPFAHLDVTNVWNEEEFATIGAKKKTESKKTTKRANKNESKKGVEKETPKRANKGKDPKNDATNKNESKKGVENETESNKVATRAYDIVPPHAPAAIADAQIVSDDTRLLQFFENAATTIRSDALHRIASFSTDSTAPADIKDILAHIHTIHQQTEETEKSRIRAVHEQKVDEFLKSIRGAPAILATFFRNTDDILAQFSHVQKLEKLKVHENTMKEFLYAYCRNKTSFSNVSTRGASSGSIFDSLYEDDVDKYRQWEDTNGGKYTIVLAWLRFSNKADEHVKALPGTIQHMKRMCDKHMQLFYHIKQTIHLERLTFYRQLQSIFDPIETIFKEIQNNAVELHDTYGVELANVRHEMILAFSRFIDATETEAKRTFAFATTAEESDIYKNAQDIAFDIAQDLFGRAKSTLDQWDEEKDKTNRDIRIAMNTLIDNMQNAKAKNVLERIQSFLRHFEEFNNSINFDGKDETDFLKAVKNFIAAYNAWFTKNDKLIKKCLGVNDFKDALDTYRRYWDIDQA